MSFLREPGDLARTPLAAVLLEAWNLRLSGELTVRQPGGDSRLYFRDGVAVGAQTYAGFQPLGQLLLARGHIDIDALGRSLAEMARSGRRQGEILVEMGSVSQEVVDRALEEQQSGYLALIAGLAEGTFTFSEDAPVPPWAGNVLASPLRAVVDALATAQGEALCAAALAQAPGTLALAEGYDELEAAFSWDPAEARLVERLRTAGSAAEILAASDLPAPRARAAVAALLLLSLAEPAGEVVDLGALGAAAAGPSPSPPARFAEPASSGAARPDRPSRPVPPREVPVLSPSGPPRAAAASADGTVHAAAPEASPPGPPRPAAPAGPTAPVAPARRGDPEEARARRQRLLARAMQNLGTGPLAGGHPPPAPAGVQAAAPAPASGPRPPLSAQEVEVRRALEAALPLAREPDLFARLGLPRGASIEEVKTAYLRAVRRFHPDRHGSPAMADLQHGLREVLAALNEAYAVLSDKARRNEYLAVAAGGGRATSDAAAAQAGVDARRAEAATRAGDHARARIFLEAAVRSDRRPEYLVALAGAILAGGRAEERDRARTHLEEAMRDAACAPAFLAAARMARDDGDIDRAEKLYRGALRADPRSEDAGRELRLLQGRRQSRAEARADAKK